MATEKTTATELGDVRDTLAGIEAVAALLAGAPPSKIHRAAALRLIELKAACGRIRLEQLAARTGAS